jgi:predicted esterase
MFSVSLLRRLIVLSVLCCFAAAAHAAEAPADSLYMTVESAGAMKGWMSVGKSPLPDGNIRYRGSAALEGGVTVQWTLDMTADLRSYVRATSHMKTPEMTVESESVHEPGGKPKVTVVWNGTKMNPPTEKLPQRALWIPQITASALLPLSELLAGEDCASFAADWIGTNGGQKLQVQVRGAGTQRIARRDGEIEARAFALTVVHEEAKEPVVLTLLQFPDGSFMGMLQGETRFLVVGGPATADPTQRVSETMVPGTGGMLGATLVLPVRAEGDTAPLPGVVLVAGPAVADRDADHGGFPFFAHLAGGLAAQGIATLRYDRREPLDGVLDLADLAADAAAALRLLADQPEVDPNKLLLLGHGEGAMLLGEAVALAAADSVHCRGLILIGGVTTPGSELQATHPRPADAPWLASYLTWDLRPRLAELQLPMLLLHGDLDAEVPFAQMESLKTYLSEHGHYMVSVMPAKSMNHCLQRAETGAVAEYGSLEPACSELLIKRIAGHVGYCTR